MDEWLQNRRYQERLLTAFRSPDQANGLARAPEATDYAFGSIRPARYSLDYSVWRMDHAV